MTNQNEVDKDETAPLSEKVGVVGELTFEITHEDGTTETHKEKNLMVNTGLAFVASRMIGNTPAVVSHMGVGTGATAPVAGNTALESPISGRATVSASASGAVVTYVAVFGPGVATGAWTEAALFNAASLGTMTCRTTFGVKTKLAGDSFTVTWTNTIAAAQ